MIPSNPNLGSSIAVVGGFLFLLLLPFDQLLTPFGLNEFKMQYIGDILKNSVIIIGGIFLIIQFGYTKISGLTQFKPKHTILVLIPLYFILAGPAEYIVLGYQFDNVNPINVLILFLAMMSVGFSEEIIFRGFVLPHLIKGAHSEQSLLAPIVLSAFMFGVLHFFNLFQTDSHFVTVLAQVIYATMFGVGFAIMLLRTGSIYPIGFLHGIINFASNWDDLPGTVITKEIANFRTYEAIVSVLIVLPFFFYMLKQLPKIDRKSLMERYNT
ncbi:CPBP family intramembrane metalloprotease [Aureisphaera galaxeae]|uniref:CPBP family intramembrane glutamic endopeptidase n=1 Tax=Aureisphaera galaxeae TaxID=1538023 RepID=UPI0023510623|nr:CPBP family intramembrane glutamic endopeptidase [Aureisphaera galaxeae]MDC8006121.1 CPBP family intramembrane metalloprotease [Aureisphaera galaxeae]